MSSFRSALVVILLLLHLLAGGMGQRQPTALAQPPTANPGACDDMIDLVLPELRLRMLEYWQFGGSPFQGLPTHTTPPEEPTPGDLITYSPSDQPVSWSDFAGDVLPVEMPCSLRVDVYDSGQQKGYTITASYTAPAIVRRVDGKLQRPGQPTAIYDRQITINPSINKSQSWHRRPDPPGLTKK